MEQYPGQPIDLKPFKTTFIVCAVIPEIVLLLALVLWVVLDGETPQPDLVSMVHLVVFGVIGAIVVVGAPFVRRSMLAATGPMRGSYGVVIEGQPAALARVSNAAIIGMAMFELPSLLGFVLSFLAASWGYFFIGAAVSVIGWVFMYPRPDQVRAWYARQMESASPIPGIVL